MITEEWLAKWNACESGRDWWRKCGETEHEPVIRKLMAENQHAWANWTIARLMTHDQQIEYACFAAELVLKIFEDKYPNDTRPRNAIEAARAYLKDKTEKNREAADEAAYAAAYAARAAADAAARAACAAAYAAAYAARAARAAAYAAARAADEAADAAAYATTLKTFIEYGLSLLAHGGNSD